MRDEDALREQICAIGRALFERGHIAPTDGNVSARLDARYVLCTPSGKHKGQLRPGDIVKVLVSEGRPVRLGQRASSELKMHLAIYAARPDVHAIVHAHSPSTVGLSVAGFSLEKPVVPEAILALGSIPTVPYASPTTADVPEAVASYLRHANAFVLERHGPVALGETVAQAYERLEIIEHTAKITIAALIAGGAHPLGDAEAAKLRAMAAAAGLTPGGPGPAPAPLRAPSAPRVASYPPTATVLSSPDEQLVAEIAARVLSRLSRP